VLPKDPKDLTRELAEAYYAVDGRAANGAALKKTIEAILFLMPGSEEFLEVIYAASHSELVPPTPPAPPARRR
jgi:hypothetical protein